MGQCVTRTAGLCAAALGLAGCLSDAGGGAQDFVARMRPADTLDAPKPTHAEKLNAQSVIIQNLQARRSVLPEGSASDRVATAVLAANARAAESDLRAAQLRAQAASKNWLPQIGPQVSLTSLRTVVTNIVVEQVIYDNGRKKGERAFAVADVEVAAVALAADTNARVRQGLDLYTDAAEARARHALARQTFKDMQHFEWIMTQRVQGGVSDMSDLHILRQKLAEIRSRETASAEAAQTALAELGAMAVGDVTQFGPLGPVPVRADLAQPLSVTRAEAEKTRAIAAAKVERAGQLPGLSAGGIVGDDSNFGVQVKSDSLLGLGTADRLRAIEATAEAAGRKVAQADEDANRTLRRLDGQIAATQRQADEAAQLTAQAKRNLDLFQQQYDAGQRQVMDVVGVYETFARQQEDEVRLTFEAVRLRTQMAEILGVLADGSKI
ncbi:TolC family protein [Sulfitobacter sp. S190]|uniref:TolC family protein n=1 Tax=Sulfitobacter sp. S190 TaxID=2867022 RepID=UPI0021A56254|nr:TolC family protein [Sulfitobacter sp. S190]UWR21567.1 TolC family protein [Sulfitobacter sp. S190]